MKPRSWTAADTGDGTKATPTTLLEQLDAYDNGQISRGEFCAALMEALGCACAGRDPETPVASDSRAARNAPPLQGLYSAVACAMLTSVPQFPGHEPLGTRKLPLPNQVTAETAKTRKTQRQAAGVSAPCGLRLCD